MEYPTGTDKSWFVGDYASRYAGSVPVSPRTPDPSDSRVSWRDREAELDADIRKGADTSVAGFIANFDRSIGSVKEMLGRGDFSGAKTKFDELQETIRTNQEEIDAFARYTGGGKTGKFLSDSAWAIKANRYFQDEIVLRDGTKTTLGKAFDSANGLDIRQTRGDLMSRSGFEDPAVHAAYFGDDARLRNAVQLFVDPALRQDASVQSPGVTVGQQMSVNPIHRQLSSAASYVASNWTKEDGSGIADVFGDGAQSFLQSVFASHKDSGGIATMIEALTANAAATRRDRPDLSGAMLANHVIAGYDDMIRNITRGDDKVDARGNPVNTGTTPDQRAMADAALVRASTEMMRRGVRMDFRDGATRNAALEVMGEITRLWDDNVDIWSMAADSGVDIADAAGKYIAGDRNSSNFFYNWRDFRNQFGNIVKGGHTVNQVMSRESGRPGDYSENLAKKLGEQSSVPELDAVKGELWKNLSKIVGQEMLNGANARTAMIRILGDPEKADRLAETMDSAFLRSFSGVGRYEVARRLSTVVLNGMRSGAGVDLEDEIFRMGFEDEAFAKSNPAAVESARNWYYGNVAADLQFSEMKAKTLKHLMSKEGGGYSAVDALHRVAQLSEQAAYNKRIGHNPATPFQATLNQVERYQDDWRPVTEGKDRAPKTVDKGYKPKAGERVMDVKGEDGKTYRLLYRRAGVKLGLEDISENPAYGTAEDTFNQRQLEKEYAIQLDSAQFRRHKLIEQEVK